MVVTDELPTSAQLRQTQQALAASQADLSRVERERDALREVAQGNKRHVATLTAEYEVVERERDEARHCWSHAEFQLTTAIARIAALTDDLEQARLHIDGYHADYQEWDGEKQEMVDASLALKADLARVTAERDQFRSNYLRDAARVDQLDGDLVDMELDLADSRALVVQVQQERDLARAELASATAELEQLRAQLHTPLHTEEPHA